MKKRETKASPPPTERDTEHKPTPGTESRSNGALAVVGIGASAGGLEAFIRLLSHLPTDTGLGFVLVQHLDPTHESALTQILSRATSMSVREVTNNLQVEPNHVYIIPPNATLAIEQQVLKLQLRPKSDAPSRTIDLFFESLARDQRERAIGIVLSGTAFDGTLGLEAIKAEGGITFAQDDSAKYDSMPRNAISAGCADFVLSPQDMASELARIAKHFYSLGHLFGSGTPEEDRAFATKHEHDNTALRSGGSGSPPTGAKRARRESEPAGTQTPDIGFKAILTLLRKHSGVDFSLYRSSTIQRRISRRMLLNKLNSPNDYADFLRGNARELDALYSDVLISVTSFFRNPEAFEFLKHKIFPKFLEQRVDDPFRVWVVGCSTGQEAYSLAMSFLECAENAPRPRSLQVFATDLNDSLLNKARRGLYTKSLAVDISPERLRRFFVEEEGGYHVSKQLRDAVVFARQNLISDPPFSRMNLISCRNTLIYLEPELQKRAIQTFHYALKPQGYLLLGTSESVGTFTNLFAQADKRHKIYARKDALTPVLQPPPKKETSERTAHAQAAALPPLQRVPPEYVRSELVAQREADRLIVNRFSPAGVLINTDLEILQFRGSTSAYLIPPTGKASFNVLKMARESLMLPLRAAINEAKKENKTARKDNVPIHENGKTRTINLEVIPLKNLKDRTFLILFGGTEKLPDPETRANGLPVNKREERARIAQLESELSETRDYLQSIQEQYEAAHEELQASSEEMQSANEELQSVNEELETSKEELESSNEELITINEEMVNRNTELSRLNSDLLNLQTSTRLAILLLGRDLTLRRFSLQAEKQFNLTAANIGLPLANLQHNLVFNVEQSPDKRADINTADNIHRNDPPVHDLESLISDVISNVREREREVQDREGRWYSLRARPYMTIDNKVDGAVLVLVDIDDLKRSYAATALLASIVDSTDDAIIGLNLNGVITSWNKSAQRLFGYTAEEAISQPITMVIPPDRKDEEREILGRIRRGEQIAHFDTTRMRKDGSPLEVSLTVSPMRDQAGRVIGASKIARDIAVRKRVERELAEKARLIDLSNDAIVVCDLNDKIRLWNKGAEKLFGWTPEEVFGKDIHSLLRTEFSKPLEEIIAELHRVGRFNGEVAQIARDGRRVLSLCGWVLDRGSGAILTSYTDISGRKLAEQALRQSQERLTKEVSALARSESALKEANVRKDEFLAMLAHELRNPLGPIVNAIHLLTRKLPNNLEDIAPLMDMLKRQTAHMTRLIGDLLDVSRVSRGKISLQRARIDLRDIVRAAVNDHRKILERSGLTVNLSIPDAPVWIDGDETRLSQALTNLLHNANKFTKAGGAVSVELVHADSIKRAYISVKDTGAGIEPELLPRLFDPFAQGEASLDRKHGGLGLGLALTKGLVELHGGSVKALSKGKGEGAEFVIELPVGSSQMLKAVSMPERPIVVKRRLLIIEDNADAAESLRMMLEINGHGVSVAEDGQTGIELAEKVLPDIILCDIGLPGLMNGYAVAEEIRRRKALENVYLIAVTGYGQPEDARRAQAAGFNFHLVKPVDPSALEDVIAKVPFTNGKPEGR